MNEPRILQANHVMPARYAEDAELKASLKTRLRQTFGEKLAETMAESPGGLIVSMLHEDEYTRRGVFDEQLRHFVVWAHVVDFPDPTVYLLKGGPHDGREMVSDGREWIHLPAPWVLSQPLMVADGPVVAEARIEQINYRRLSGTNVYEYVR